MKLFTKCNCDKVKQIFAAHKQQIRNTSIHHELLTVRAARPVRRHNSTNKSADTQASQSVPTCRCNLDKFGRPASFSLTSTVGRASATLSHITRRARSVQVTKDGQEEATCGDRLLIIHQPEGEKNETGSDPMKVVQPDGRHHVGLKVQTARLFSVIHDSLCQIRRQSDFLSSV